MDLKLGAMLVSVMVLKMHIKPTIRYCYAGKFNCQLAQISFLLLVTLLINSNHIKLNPIFQLSLKHTTVIIWFMTLLKDHKNTNFILST